MAHSDASILDKAVPLGDGAFWVGRRAPGQIFFANTYLLYEPAQEDRPAFSILIDPSATRDFPIVQAKCEAVMGDLAALDAIFINHQDPDVSTALETLLRPEGSTTHVLCSDETWQLIENIGIDRERYLNVDDYPNGFRGRSGRVVQPVPAPFCHFVGSRMLYDPRTRVLFSGDLFASLTSGVATGLFADETDWVGMRAFHQIYMPTNRAITMAIRKIRALDPPVEIIAPQHGRLLRGDILERFLDRLEKLDVGLDILSTREEEDLVLPAWQLVLNRVLELSESLTGTSPRAWLQADAHAAAFLHFETPTLELRQAGQKAIERIVEVITRQVESAYGELIRYEAIVAAHELDLPTPQIDVEEGLAATPKISSAMPFEAV